MSNMTKIQEAITKSIENELENTVTQAINKLCQDLKMQKSWSILDKKQFEEFVKDNKYLSFFQLETILKKRVTELLLDKKVNEKINQVLETNSYLVELLQDQAGY